MPMRVIGGGLVGLTLVAASTLAAAETLPTRKAGLWESKTVSAEGSTTARQCIDEKTDQLAQGALGAGNAPSASSPRRAPVTPARPSARWGRSRPPAPA